MLLTADATFLSHYKLEAGGDARRIKEKLVELLGVHEQE